MGFMPMIVLPVIILPISMVLPGVAAAAPTPDPKVKQEAKADKVPVPPRPVPPPGAGLPRALQALLRTEGPYAANEVYSVVPLAPLEAIEEDSPAPEWYAIIRGRFVGVVDEFALTEVAIRGVTHCTRKTYTTQAEALRAFNSALRWGGVEIA
ncbi:hypothetical protein C8R43DRAFT_941763 [Mycena crocata]|nr:hypothetical protein C8R43DRAFT_941763 [Mycena crocata]